MDASNINNDLISYRLSRPTPYPFFTIWGGKASCEQLPTPATFRNFYVLEYIYKGSGIVRQQDNEIPASAGDFLLHTPGYTYEFVPDKKHPWEKIWCAVSNTSFMSGLLTAYNIENIRRFPKINTPLQLENIFEILEKQDNGKDAFRAIEHMLFKSICSLSDFAPSLTHSISIAEIGKSYIDMGSFNTSINDICKQLSISSSYFFRLFRQEFGISPQDYLMKKKLDIAKDSLLYTDMSIGQISDLVGYENISSFSNFFYKKVGMTPIEFRKQYTDRPTVSEE